MRVVFDTNVLISAALKHKSIPAAAVLAAEARDTLLKSAATEKQLFDVLDRPYFAKLIDEDVRRWLRSLMSIAELVEITEPVTGCRDPTDDKFLELAVHGSADVIVSGDADLLVLNPFRGIPIVTPAEFVQGASGP